MDLWAATLALWQRYDITARTVEHLSMFAWALALSVVIGVVLGMLLYRREHTSGYVFASLNTLETFPDLALLALLIPLVGIGAAPTVIACILYSILPIARNAYTGLASVSAEHLEVAAALGLTERETLLRVRVPLALPLIAGGVRIAVVFTMGIVTLGGLIGAGGLGVPLQTGIFNNIPEIVLLAGLWVSLLAVVLDGAAGLIEKMLHRRYGGW
ncbi:ABC transporter permease [Methanofollis tationis]|uniref:ABC transporter permease n=1 Tax=Methanofollis tationis TaxID=81417 RepID=A0A7K4HLZ9_9EURY|nr:ABC transporter permease [Methanofollis tationis]NVO65908.1 ABC transporter permease [Methanofollis tationis]